MIRTPLFFNVLGGSCFTSFNQATDEEFSSGAITNFNQSPRWYSKSANPYIYSPYVLVSSAHYGHIKDLRAKMVADDDTFIFVDSGGFQLSTGVKPKHTREKALKWSENNGDMFPILDFPVMPGKGFNETLEYTRKSAKYYADNRSKDGCIIMNVLSATSGTNNIMEKAYNAVAEFPFDGWCYGGHGNSPISIIQAILFLQMKGELDREVCTYIHIFGTTSLSVIPYIIYAQHMLNQKGVNCFLSFDSSYAFKNAGYGRYFAFSSFTGMSSLVLSNKFDWSGLNSFSHFGCDCPVCQGITDIDHLFNNSGSHFYSLIGLHNFYMLEQYKKSIEGLLSVNIDDIIESLPKEMLNNFKTIKKAFDRGGLAGIDILSHAFKTSATPRNIPAKTLDQFF